VSTQSLPASNGQGVLMLYQWLLATSNNMWSSTLLDPSTMPNRVHPVHSMEERTTSELTFLSRQWISSHELDDFALWMASSEVDQKFLGHFAKYTSFENPYLSAMLYKVLGLSLVMSKKLDRARKLRRLDPTRDARSVQHLYHHILWLSREGLVMTEQYILPMVGKYVELKVLAHKLRGSFYHIFVLFHNKPSINQASGPFSLFSEPLSPLPLSSRSKNDRDSILHSPPPQRSASSGDGPVDGAPPGLPPPKPTASNSGNFILPSVDYIPTATSCFAAASDLAENLLPGSHPVRLSVKLEYVAYLYDCLHEKEESRRLAQRTVADVYSAHEGMDDESFEDAAEMVRVLGKMMKRGLDKGGSASARVGGSGSARKASHGGSGSGSGSSGTARAVQQNASTNGSIVRTRGGGGDSGGGKTRVKVSPRGSDRISTAVPSAGMTNPI
jgi:hypothetical protein